MKHKNFHFIDSFSTQLPMIASVDDAWGLLSQPLILGVGLLCLLCLL